MYSHLVLLLLSITCSSAWIVSLEELPEVNQAGLNFVAEAMEQFGSLASQGYSVHKHYIVLKSWVEKVVQDLQLLANQDPIISSGNNFLHRSNGIILYQALASKCLHQLNFANQWISERVGYFNIERDQNRLSQIQQQIQETVDEIDDVTPKYMEKITRTKEKTNTLLKTLTYAVKPGSSKINRGLMVSKAKSVVRTIEQLILKEIQKPVATNNHNRVRPL